MKITAYYDLVSLLTYSTPTWASLVAGLFLLVTLSLSMYLLFEHLSAYKNPEVCCNSAMLFMVHTVRISSKFANLFLFFIYLFIYLPFGFFLLLDLSAQEQKFLIGVILMVPCYAIESVSIYFPGSLISLAC